LRNFISGSISAPPLARRFPRDQTVTTQAIEPPAHCAIRAIDPPAARPPTPTTLPLKDRACGLSLFLFWMTYT
jgi:hypothetical protein